MPEVPSLLELMSCIVLLEPYISHLRTRVAVSVGSCDPGALASTVAAASEMESKRRLQLSWIASNIDARTQELQSRLCRANFRWLFEASEQLLFPIARLRKLLLRCARPTSLKLSRRLGWSGSTRGRWYWLVGLRGPEQQPIVLCITGLCDFSL